MSCTHTDTRGVLKGKEMNVYKQHVWHRKLFCVKLGINVAKAAVMNGLGEKAPSCKTVRKWFSRFLAKHFRLIGNKSSGVLRKLLDEEIQSVIEENPAQGLLYSLEQDNNRNFSSFVYTSSQANPCVSHELTQRSKNLKVDICL